MLKEYQTLYDPESDLESVRAIACHLHTSDDPQASLKLLVEEQEYSLPAALSDAIQQIVRSMASGQGVYIIPQESEMTTTEAANFLGVSRPHLVKLLQEGEIPFVKTGNRHRIRVSDVLRYKQRKEARRKEALADLIQFTQEEGFYNE